MYISHDFKHVDSLTILAAWHNLHLLQGLAWQMHFSHLKTVFLFCQVSHFSIGLPVIQFNGSQIVESSVQIMTHICWENITMNLAGIPLISIVLSIKRKGLILKKRTRSFTPVLNGFLSLTSKWEWMWSRRSVSMSRQRGSRICLTVRERKKIDYNLQHLIHFLLKLINI